VTTPIFEHTNLKSDIRSHRYVLFPTLRNTLWRREILIIAYSHPYINEIYSGLAHGCFPWGTSTIAGSKGERVTTEGELEVAVHQSKVSYIPVLNEKLVVDVRRICRYLCQGQAGLTWTVVCEDGE